MVTRRADCPRLFIEDPAGLAAVSLRLHGGPNCRPPISRMGSKTGYAQTILAALGLQSGQGAGAYLWVEADRDVAALLRCYPDADMLRRIAEIIRGWADEEPRALWERLRAERREREVKGGPWVGDGWEARDVSGWLIEGMWSYRQGDLTSGGPVLPGERRQDTTAAAAAAAAARLAEYAVIVASNRLIHMAGPDLMNTGKGGTRFGADFATPAPDVAERFEGMADAIASHSTLAAWTKGNTPGDSLYMGPDRPSRCHPPGWTASITARGIAKRFVGVADEAAKAEEERFEGMAREVAGFAVSAVHQDRSGGFNAQHVGSPGDRRPYDIRVTADYCARIARGWPPVIVTRRIPEPAEVAEWLGTPGDLSGVVRYADPPYLGTTGYAHDYPRAEVVRLALAYAAMGATVCVSEATPIPELVEAGWEVCEITGGRVGQKRTFSAQKREFLTMNRAPAHRVAEQVGMFGGAA